MNRLNDNDVTLRPMRDTADDYAAMGRWVSDDGEPELWERGIVESLCDE
jgi:hypothetical protein